MVLEWDANFAASYTIQTSNDNNAWTTVNTTANADGANDTIDFGSQTARYIKLDTTNWSSGSQRVWLREFEVYSEGGLVPTPTPSPTPTPTITPEPGGNLVMHICDLDGSSSSVNRRNWVATVTVWVHDAGENPVAGATVSGSWSDGASSASACVTAADGSCQLVSGNLKTNIPAVTFSVSSVARSTDTYDASANHDPDGDSDGTSITITTP